MIAADDVDRATTGGVTGPLVQPTMIFGLGGEVMHAALTGRV